MTPPEKPPFVRHANRRAFLKTSIAATAGAAALGGLSPARGAHAAGSDVIRVGLIGCGGRGPGAALDAMCADPGVRLVALADVFADKVESRRRMLKKEKPDRVQVDDAHCFSGLDGYQHVIESSDVVLIACAAKYHPVYLLAAVQAGKHVFVEKPHAIDPVGVRQAAAACELARQKKLSVLSGLNSRYDWAFQEAIKRIHDGAIGDIVSVEQNYLRTPYGLCYRQPGQNEVRYQFANLYHFAWLCGDNVAQFLIHNLDLTGWAMHEQTPIKAHGLGGRSSCFGEVYGDIFDHHSVVYEYANGVRMYAFARMQNGCYDEFSSTIFGTKGKFVAFPPRYYGITGEKPWKNTRHLVDSHKVEQVALLQAIRSGQPLNSGFHMANSTMVAVMGQLSCYCGKELTWDQVSKSDFVFTPKVEDVTLDMDISIKPGPGGIYPTPMPGLTEFKI